MASKSTMSKEDQAKTTIDVIDTKISFILEFNTKLEKRLESIESKMENSATIKYVDDEVTRSRKSILEHVNAEYGLTKRIVYGACGVVLFAVFSALVALIIIKP